MALILVATAACQRPDPVATPAPTSPRPVARPDVAPTLPTQADLRAARAERNRAANRAAIRAAATTSTASISQRDFYARMETRLRADGRLRRDRAPADAPFTADDLARNFIRIALFDEYSRDGDRLIAQARPAPLRRWADPVRIRLEFGPSSDAAERSAWRAQIGAFAARLSRVTGHPVSMTADAGNFNVLILTDDERRAIGPRLADLIPGIPAQDVAMLADLPPDISCSVFAYSRGAQATYSYAVALIRAELPPLLRTSCIHEELAQGMGLANDSPAARPSIFNDDEEFALLTRHDEFLLKILYDPRLRPGMSEAEAAPIVRKIARELLGDAA
ncbi:DUF2927 domain-containing protein [Paracoccus sp. (in: a-proteobacteria)]|uniref:DUF2927 domain-containing protein n=1 Tax=Paracoccus sp. TaxID=267 RepID=UPI0026DEFE3A|nr:DUF2927 domain-containing protein [Paracoccus sp. (in: a-proteobacteria)]MDO5648174.1 DUF2927 domain-containing protein [Paracoccus sp. (in: a-proteobacteria)]